MTYHIKLFDSAIKTIKRLDKPIARRIMERIRWVSENFDSTGHTPCLSIWQDFTKSESEVTGQFMKF